MKSSQALARIYTLAHIDLEKYQTDPLELDERDWEEVLREALEWREIGEPQEAAEQLLQLAKVISYSAFKEGGDVEEIQDRVLCFYALCEAEAHCVPNDPSEQRICAE